RAPVRDLCPALRNIRLRVRRRLAQVEKEIASTPRSVAFHEARVSSLAREREQLLEALERLCAASERGLARGDRVRELETLLDHLPDCVTQKARARVRLLIEGLGSAA
ncbi:MAG TPA: hypothetical protein VII36_00125, partial [Usitatibacter sp.]